MSGGHYQYAYSGIDNLAGAIADDIRRNSKPDQYGYAPRLPRPVLKRLRLLVRALELTATACRDVEWCYSGDTGNDTLAADLERWEVGMRRMFVAGRKEEQV